MYLFHDNDFCRVKRIFLFIQLLCWLLSQFYKLSFALPCVWAYCFSKAQIAADHLGFVITGYFLFIPCCFFPPLFLLKHMHHCPSCGIYCLSHPCMYVVFRLKKSFSTEKWIVKYWVMLHTVSPHCNSFCSKMRANLLRWLALAGLGVIEILRNDKFLKCQPRTSGEWANLLCAWSPAGKAVTASHFCNKASSGTDSPGLGVLTDGVCNLFVLHHSGEIFSKLGKKQNQFISCLLMTRCVESPSPGRLRSWWASVYKLDIL